jgi:Phosphotransferase enzyme family
MSDRSHRLDWALLLPTSAAVPFDEVLVLGGDDQLGQSLVDRGLAASWRRPRTGADRCEFVVAWNDCRLDIGRIAGHVGTGGLLYLEIDRRLPGRRRLGSRSVRRELSRAGCCTFSTHIVTPTLERPRRYLPIDHPRAIRWHLRALFVASTPFTRTARICLAAVLATPIAGAVLRLVMVRYIVVGTMDEDRSAPLGVPEARGNERVILVTSGYDQASRAVVLPFEPDDRSPKFAVKVASSSTTTIGTLREHARLISLHATLPASTARALPTPMGTYTVAERTACVQSYAPGPSMSASVGRWGRPFGDKCRDLDVVVDWLIEFAAATRVASASAAWDWTQTYFEAATTIDFPAGVVDFLEESQRTARSSTLGETAVHQHYDAGPWNVHIDKGQPSLIDWETDDLRPPDCLGPPLADVLYLATYWYFLTSKADSETDEEAAIVRLFAQPLPVDAGVVAARTAIDRALVGLGLERQVVPAVLAALWAERAVYTNRRRAGLGVPIDTGRSRPEAYLRALAGAMPAMCANDGWWALTVGKEPQ